MRRRLLIVGLVLGTASCAGSLGRLQHDMERASAYQAAYTQPPSGTPACDRALAQLEAVAQARDVTVVYQPMNGGMAGHGMAYVDSRLNSCGRVEFLAHELAHLLQPANLTPAEAQVFADAVSYRYVREVAGYDPRDRYATYLGQFKNASHIFNRYRAEIAATVAVLRSCDGSC